MVYRASSRYFAAGILITFSGQHFTSLAQVARGACRCCGQSIFSLLLAVMILLSSLELAAQTKGLDPNKRLTQYICENWREDEGLPQNSVQSIVQARDGYLWFATQEGVVRFDGVRFTIFDKLNTPAIKHNYIQQVFEDSRGNLWISMQDNGVTIYSKGRFRHLGTEQGLQGDVIDISEDSKGNLWFASTNGLYNFDNDRFTKFTALTFATASETPSAVIQSGRGTLLVGTNNGVYEWDAATKSVKKHYTIADGLTSNRILTLYRSPHSKDVAWIGTDNGACRLENGMITTTYTTADGLPHPVVGALCEDAFGTLYVATNGGGLCRFIGKRAETLTPKNNDFPDRLTALCEDREGSLWVGANGGGLLRLKNGKFTPFGVPEGLPVNMLWSIFQARDGSIWLSTDGAGIVHIENGVIKQVFNKDNGLPDNAASAIYEARDGTMWVSTRRLGIAKIQGGKVVATYSQEKGGLPGQSVSAFLEDKNGTFWITGGRGKMGVIGSNGVISTVLTTADGFPDAAARCMYEDRQGNLWIGTRGGLVKYANGRIEKVYTKTDGMAANSVMCIYEDADGVLWLGLSGGGLARFKQGKFTAYLVKHGLSDENVYSVLEDSKGYLWMSCNRGIMRVSKAELNGFADGKNTSISSILFGKSDGMRSSECNGGNQPSALAAKDGRFWFPTIAGAAIVDPNNIPRNTFIPQVHVESLIADSEPIAPTESGEFVVPAGKVNFEIHFTALSLLFPSKVRFKYKLEGFDKDWVDAGTRRTAFYTNISPGSHTFRVIACNNDGVWNEAGATLEFYFRPYFWQTWWFRGLCICLVAFGIYYAYRRRIHLAEQREAELNRRIEEMVVDLRVAHQATLEEKASVEKKVEEAVRNSEEARKYLADSVEAMLNEMTRFANGNLTVRLTPRDTRDDIGRLFLGFNQAVENMRKMLNEVAEAVNITARESEEISSSADQMAQDAARQEKQVREVSAAISDMTERILESARGIGLVATIATEAGDSATEGGKIVSETVQGINNINDVVEELAHTVQRLGKSSEQIGDILEVITRIASQTNLLALNASIEAARAGEYGKGFAVVADEIRKLAESTTVATKQITEMVEQIQEDIRVTMKSMRQGTKETKRGKELAEKAGAALKNIIKQTHKVSSVTKQIAKASTEQTQAGQTIRRRMDEMITVVEQLLVEINEIAGGSDEVNRLATNLQKLVRQFRITEVELNKAKSEHTADILKKINNGELIGGGVEQMAKDSFRDHLNPNKKPDAQQSQFMEELAAQEASTQEHSTQPNGSIWYSSPTPSAPEHPAHNGHGNQHHTSLDNESKENTLTVNNR
jgi:methyl-accepting chemotaxis protein/ligand-binding sensor domain-containing protein